MINLVGEKLKQYELGRKITTRHRADVVIEEVWYTKGGIRLAVPFIDVDNIVTADIPNIMLKSFGNMTVEVIGVDESGNATKDRATFYVSHRAKPAGYVYEETETVGVLNEADSGGGGGGESYDLIIEYSGATLAACSTGSLEYISGEQSIVREKAMKGEFARVLLRHRTTYLTTPTFSEDIPLAVDGPSNPDFWAYGMSAKEKGVIGILCNEDGTFTMNFTAFATK